MIGKTMKKILITSAVIALLSTSVLAKTVTKNSMTLRDQMDSMILSVADMDIMVNKNQETDFAILAEDAQRILDALVNIKALDKAGVFTKHITNLEKPAQALLKLAKKQDPLASAYPEQIFNACFKCHSEHRAQPVFKSFSE